MSKLADKCQLSQLSGNWMGKADDGSWQRKYMWKCRLLCELAGNKILVIILVQLLSFEDKETEVQIKDCVISPWRH